MQRSIYQYLQTRSDLKHFVRMNPIWYRRLTRNPDEINQLEEEAKYFYGKTTSQRIEKFTGQVQMVSMLMQMAQSMKS